MRRFTLHWGVVEVFADEPVPERLTAHAASDFGRSRIGGLALLPPPPSKV
ncbi:MAG: hypothetical protein HOV94_09670 [Saccharothrix sp.]|nr:hypothetical protein [Saccharothrix sp.]